MNFKNKHKPGVSLIVAIIFVSFLMLTAAGIVEDVLHMTKASGLEMNRKAVLRLTQSAINSAQWLASHNVAGANVSSESQNTTVRRIMDVLMQNAEDMGINECEDVDEYDGNGMQPCVGFEVKGFASESEQVSFENGKYYSVPVRGTGSAVFGKSQAAKVYKNLWERERLCETVMVGGNADGEGGEQVGIGNADNPCNWNRLHVGDSVEIPLYYVDDDGAEQKLDNNAKLKLRVRSPCTSDLVEVPLEAGLAGAMEDLRRVSCAPGERVNLYPAMSDEGEGPYLNVDEDQVLVQWLISSADGRDVMVARGESIGRYRPAPTIDPDLQKNSELTASRINDANNAVSRRRSLLLENFLVLYESLKGQPTNTVAPETIATFTNRITSPTLLLQSVGQPRQNNALKDENGNITAAAKENYAWDAPYLEYQILASQPITDSKSLLIGKVNFRGFGREVFTEKEKPATLSGFVLGNL